MIQAIRSTISALTILVLLVLCSCRGVPADHARALCESAVASADLLEASAHALKATIEQQARVGCEVCRFTDAPRDCCDQVIDHVVASHGAEYKQIEAAALAQKATVAGLVATKTCKGEVSR